MSSKDVDTSVKMYILVNNDLKMGKGKIAGQVGHSVSSLVRKLEKNPTKNYIYWLANGEAKIIIKSTEEEMLKLRKKYSDKTVEIRDLGKTQIEPDSLTTIGFIPLKPDEVPKEILDGKIL